MTIFERRRTYPIVKTDKFADCCVIRVKKVSQSYYNKSE